jgi:hypothetical protein
MLTVSRVRAISIYLRECRHNRGAQFRLSCFTLRAGVTRVHGIKVFLVKC